MEDLRKQLLEAAIQDAQDDHPDKESIHPEKLMSDEILRLRALVADNVEKEV